MHLIADKADYFFKKISDIGNNFKINNTLCSYLQQGLVLRYDLPEARPHISPGKP